MEFILHLPQDIDKDGALWQIWNSFNQKFKNCQSTKLHGTSLMDATSLLLFAAHHQINSICSSLKMYDMDLPKLNKVLEVVEQACLPYFILLFERFRYFNLKRDPSDNFDDFVIFLRQQAEVCEFGNLKDSIMTNAVCSSLKSESLMQCSSNTDGFCLDNSKTVSSEVERLHGNRDIKVRNAESMTCRSSIIRNKDLETLSRSSDDKQNSEDTDISSCNIFRTDNADHSVFYKGNGINTHHSVREEEVDKFTENSWKLKKRTRHKGAKKVDKLFLADTKIQSGVADYERFDESYDVLSKTCDKHDADCNTNLIAAIINTKIAEKNVLFIRFHCCFCEKAFSGQNCLRKHLLSKHVGCTDYSCRICTSVFLNVEEYLVHYKNAHLVEQQKSHSSRPPTVKLRITRDIRRFHCSLCRRSFIKEGYLRRHVHYTHAKSFMCWNCEESFQSLSEYKQHSEKHVIIGRFSCDLCHKQHQSIFRLISHLKNHLMPQNKCEICGVAFIKQESLAKHKEKHIDEPAHKCKICGKTFVIESRLQYHMRTHSGEKRFTCELCGKNYSQKINLVHHKRWHTGEQPFECEICGKRTRSSGDLSKHKRKHSDKYSYVCEICGRGFNYSSALLKHRMGHTGKRSYACDVCGRTFIYREGLRDHIKASRCPGRRSESGYNRTPRATKLLQSGMSNNLIDVESKVVGQVQSETASGTSLKDIPDWHCMLRSNEADGGTNVVLVPSFY